MQTLLQQIQIKRGSDFEVAKTYYSILFKLNNISIANRELELVAFCSVYGTISTPPVSKEFMKTFKVSRATIYNMTSKLQRKKIMVKRDGKIRVNPAIQVDFSKGNLLLQIKILKEVKEETEG